MVFSNNLLAAASSASTSGAGYTIENAIYLDGSADYLNFTPFTTGSKQDFTISFWMKLVNPDFSSTSYVLSAGDGTGNEEFAVAFLNSEILRIFSVSSGSTYQNFDYRTSQVFRDPTAWQNWVITFDHNNGTVGDILRLFINGSEITSFSTETHPVSGEIAYWTDAVAHNIGRTVQGSNYAPMYLAEFISLDGTSVTDATDFGEYDDNDVWIPKDPSGLSFGTNGYHLKFDESTLLGKSSNSTTTPTVSFLGSNVQSSVSTHTVPDATLGAAASNRSIVIAAGGARADGGTRTATCTVGGSAATEIVRSFSGKPNCLYFFIIDVPTGTEADIVVSYSGGNNTMEAAGIAWWRVLDAGQPISISTANADGWSSIPITNIGQDGDVTIYGLFDSGSATGFNWSDATERADHPNITNGSSTLYGFTAADYAYSSGESHTETVSTASGSGNETSYAAITLSNNNTFTTNSIAAANQVTDTCTDSADDDIGNYCTWNPICAFPSGNVSLSNGNTQAVITADGAILANQFFDVTDSDGFYWETKVTANIGNATHIGIGQQTVPLNNTSYLNNGIASYLNDGGADHTSSDRHSSGTFPTYTNNDVIGVAVKGGAIWFSKNNTWINSATASEIAAGTTTNAVFTGLTGMWTPMVREHNGTNTTSTTNWGATSFAYTPPTGLKRLMTADRSAPTVTNSGNFFNTVLYTGNGSSRTISGVGFQPDWVWIKDRPAGENHYSFDAVRGAEKRVHQNLTDAEGTESTALTGFASDGFTLGNGSAGANTSSRTYVAWCWKAGGSGSSNSDGDIASTVSVASHGGFSIVKYDPGSGGSPGDTVGHGLSRTPNYIILKALENVGDTNWSVGSDDIGWTNNIFLNLNNARSAGSGAWNNTAPGSSVFTIGSDTDNNTAYIAYCFAKTPGLIACGKYAGNNSTDGPFVQVDDGGSGFKPAWIMIKNITSAGNWFIYDNQRNTHNVVNAYLIADGADTEATSGPVQLDFTANGFKLRSTNDGTNGSSDTYVYLAFSENPFGGSGVAQAKAR